MNQCSCCLLDTPEHHMPHHHHHTGLPCTLVTTTPRELRHKSHSSSGNRKTAYCARNRCRVTSAEPQCLR
ncbi:hypothetical protein E2C01_052802 [Portunus trituberculatus]|uniref:Uncharacterized protein n=1 Tax=Portunus trituberculatus TaxID=210409 RepID=A0A5B7GMP8_PORTR|nr:hypothetical protein [Portunus trituberculatus]